MKEHTPSTKAAPTPGTTQGAESIPMLEWGLGSWHLSVERMPLRSDELTALYDRVAASWNRRLDRLGFLKAYHELMRGLLSDGPLARLPEGAWVLDAGTGTGALALALDAQHRRLRRGPPLMFSAIDRSSEMLKVAQASFDAARLDAKVQRGDVRRLPYASDTFDLVMAAHIVEHLADPERALHELVRVLRPGAPLLLVVTRRSLPGALVQLRWRVHRAGQQDLTTWLKGCGITDLRFTTLPGPFWCRHLSLVCTGRKRSKPSYPLAS